MKKIRLGDGLIIAAVLLLAVLTALTPLLFKNDGSTLSILADGETTAYSLAQNRTIELTANDHTLTIVIENGKAFVQSADCPDKTCLHTGAIAQTGEVIVCVPSRVLLRITERGESHDHDAIAG